MGAAHGAPVEENGAAYRTGIAGSDSSRGRRAILHIVSSLGVGGMERMLLQLATAQQEAGHSVSVLALRAGPLEQEAADRSIRTKVLSGGTGRFGRSLEALRFFRAERPDIVHVHNPTSLQYAVLSKLVSRAAIVVTIHGDQDTHARLGSSIEWGLTSAAVIVSHAAGKTLRLPSHAGRLIVVHNGIAAADANEKHRADARAELSAGDSCVGNHGGTNRWSKGARHAYEEPESAGRTRQYRSSYGLSAMAPSARQQNPRLFNSVSDRIASGSSADGRTSIAC